MENKRDIGSELLEAISSIKRGEGKRYKIETLSDVETVTPDLVRNHSTLSSQKKLVVVKD